MWEGGREKEEVERREERGIYTPTAKSKHRERSLSEFTERAAPRTRSRVQENNRKIETRGWGLAAGKATDGTRAKAQTPKFLAGNQ